MKLLSLLSGSWLGPAIVAAVLAIAATWHFAAVRDAREKGNAAGAAGVQAQWDAAKVKALEAAGAERQRLQDTFAAEMAVRQKALDEATKNADLLRADSAAARDTVARLRADARTYAARRCPPAGAPAAPAGGASAAGPGFLLADMSAGLGEAGRAMAEEADRRRIAGLACERIYDGLAPTN